MTNLKVWRLALYYWQYVDHGYGNPNDYIRKAYEKVFGLSPNTIEQLLKLNRKNKGKVLDCYEEICYQLINRL